MASEENFDTGDAGASQTYPQQCSSLRKNGYVLLKSRPCKIVDMSTSKTGKHGHAKVHLVGLDLFNAKKYEDICPSTHNMEVPNVKRKDYLLIDIDANNYLTLLEDDGAIKDDLNLPTTDIGKEISDKHKSDQALVLTVLSAMGEEQVVSYKLDNNK
ncbi:eukaryotic translation initiation factor 5A-1 [Octopus bimaculoides]|uniref:Eukaryotic translation initiation factor 5A n=1 Tax=Octopus bimaculoides TaxID=37653 RepID=A0A0L8GDV7_OCTBM|nr:eukaryotic translation initiation factor 5A-1 [Octopus bimaculoides]|eukprot:XP_014781960.1 PREDICTED: eukaryotic translation initiation factor 5A-1-like [Octopus bimaculoides]